MVLNIFQESEADIEDFMQQKLDAEEGVGFIIYCLFLIVNLTFYIHFACIWYMYFVFDWICHKIFTQQFLIFYVMKST